VQDILSLLQSPAFSAWGAPVSWAELFGLISGALCVWLVARQNIWSWPIGLLNNALFFVLFIAAKLYGDAALQVVFAILAVYGWYQWLRPSQQQGLMRVRRTTEREWTMLAMCGLAGIAAATYISRSLFLTAILYAGFLLLCVMGLHSWSRDLTSRPVEQPA